MAKGKISPSRIETTPLGQLFFPSRKGGPYHYERIFHLETLKLKRAFKDWCHYKRMIVLEPLNPEWPCYIFSARLEIKNITTRLKKAFGMMKKAGVHLIQT